MRRDQPPIIKLKVILWTLLFVILLMLFIALVIRGCNELCKCLDNETYHQDNQFQCDALIDRASPADIKKCKQQFLQ